MIYLDKEFSVSVKSELVRLRRREQVREAKETKPSELRSMLWPIHQPFGLSPRVKSYTPTPEDCR